MIDHVDQYTYTIFERLGGAPERRLAGGYLSDPFITTRVWPRGWRAALAVLVGRYEVTLHVDGTQAAFRVVFCGDYTPDPPRPPRSNDGDGHAPA